MLLEDNVLMTTCWWQLWDNGKHRICCSLWPAQEIGCAHKHHDNDMMLQLMSPVLVCHRLGMSSLSSSSSSSSSSITSTITSTSTSRPINNCLKRTNLPPVPAISEWPNPHQRCLNPQVAENLEGHAGSASHWAIGLDFIHTMLTLTNAYLVFIAHLFSIYYVYQKKKKTYVEYYIYSILYYITLY